MPTNHTPHYNLSQWERNDRILMDDFNADNAKIDAALGVHAAELAKLPFCGNCQIYTADYKGTGECGETHPNTLSFPKKPVWITIFTPDGRSQFNIFPNDITYGFSTASRDYKVCITWKGNTVSWYANEVFVQMNYDYYTYHVIAFCPMD